MANLRSGDAVVAVMEEQHQDRRVGELLLESPQEIDQLGRANRSDVVEQEIRFVGGVVVPQNTLAAVEEGTGEAVRVIVVGVPLAEEEVDAFVVAEKLRDVGAVLFVDLEAEVAPAVEECILELGITIPEGRMDQGLEPAALDEELAGRVGGEEVAMPRGIMARDTGGNQGHGGDGEAAQVRGHQLSRVGDSGQRFANFRNPGHRPLLVEENEIDVFLDGVLPPRPKVGVTQEQIQILGDQATAEIEDLGPQGLLDGLRLEIPEVDAGQPGPWTVLVDRVALQADLLGAERRDLERPRTDQLRRLAARLSNDGGPQVGQQGREVGQRFGQVEQDFSRILSVDLDTLDLVHRAVQEFRIAHENVESRSDIAVPGLVAAHAGRGALERLLDIVRRDAVAVREEHTGPETKRQRASVFGLLPGLAQMGNPIAVVRSDEQRLVDTGHDFRLGVGFQGMGIRVADGMRQGGLQDLRRLGFFEGLALAGEAVGGRLVFAGFRKVGPEIGDPGAKGVEAVQDIVQLMVARRFDAVVDQVLDLVQAEQVPGHLSGEERHPGDLLGAFRGGGLPEVPDRGNGFPVGVPRPARGPVGASHDFVDLPDPILEIFDLG